MKEGYKSFIYYKFRATFSNVALVETEDPKRTQEMINFFLERNVWPWQYDHADRTVFDIITAVHDLIETINRARSTKETKHLSREETEAIIKKLHEQKFLELQSEDSYRETGKKKPEPTQILHYDVWEGLRVNVLRSDKNVYQDRPKWLTWGEYQELRGVKKEKNDPLAGVFQKEDTERAKMNLEAALNIIDNEIKKTRTVAILTGIIPSPGAEKELKTFAEAVNNWVHNIETLNQESIVIVITPDRNILPQTTLNNVIFVRPKPSATDERAIIIETLGNKYDLEDIRKEELTKALAGLTLHQCETVLLESFLRTKKFKTEYISTLKQEQVEKQGLLSIIKPTYGFDRIGGYNSVKKFIREGIIDVFNNPELASELQLEPLRSVLLFGIWGSGKSLLAKALAHETNLPLFQFQPGSVFDKYVGETERKTRNAIEIMEANSPCIILIEEADSLGHRSNTDTDSGTSRRVFGQLLDYMGQEDRKSIIFGTTNTPEYLDSAFLREGRFTSVPMLLPDFHAREEIFRVHLYEKRNLKTRFLECQDSPLIQFAEETPAFTGAEIEGVVKAAQRIAFREKRGYITDDDILTGIEGYNISTEERMRTQNDYLETAERICRNREFLEELRLEHIINGG